MTRARKRGIPEAILLCAFILPLPAQMDHSHHMAAAAKMGAPVTVGGLKFPDSVLVNQRGEKVHFYSDLIKGKTVAINTIFTTCTTICPLMGANFAKVRKLIGDRPDVTLISISIDPTEDTPARLDEWQRGFGASGAGWTLLTGDRNDVLALLRALQVFTPDKQDHEPVVLVGGDGATTWSRASALMPAADLTKLILSLTGH
jgi:protein SCO1